MEVSLRRKPKAPIRPERTRRVSDMCVGETAYMCPWHVDISLRIDAFIDATPHGTADMGIKRVSEDEYEVWLE